MSAFISTEIFLVVVFLCMTFLRTGHCISCYQCNSTDHVDPFQCGEYMTDDIDIEPASCKDVFEAAYCIKHTGRFEASSIYCYQCATPTNIDCSDLLIHDYDGRTVNATSCGFMYGATHCIKTTGIYAGGIGTKRFCSSLDLGNYCNYIKQPGDQLIYRSCVYTCSSDGCNTASTSLLVNVYNLMIGVGLTTVLYVYACSPSRLINQFTF